MEQAYITPQQDAIAKQEEEELPPLSPWHYIFMSKIPIWRYDDQTIIRFNLSEENFFPYYACHISFTLLYFYYIFYLRPFIHTFQKFHFYFSTFTFIMTHLCYFVTHFSNPGILPWYWATTKQRVYTIEELRGGFATNQDQVQWGKTHDWPIRGFFSGHHGCIVLRADHFCSYISQWIGLKNNRYFVQSVFYCTISLFHYEVLFFKVYQDPEFVRTSFTYIGFILAVTGFLFLHGPQLFSVLWRVATNKTFIELYFGQENVYSKDIISNFEEIFGTRKLFPLWFFPIPLPLPNDGFSYQPRPFDIALAANRMPSEPLHTHPHMNIV